MGVGSPTVILTPGLGDWSLSWRAVQPEIAKSTRVCAWDRAGSGFSDPSREPQDVVHTTRDLEKLLAAKRIRPPYVLVGHSYGSFETLMFAFRHPGSVAGMVLVDPSVAGQYERFRAVAPSGTGFIEWTEQEQLANLRGCVARARGRRFKPNSPAWNDCVDPPPSNYPAGLRAAILRMETSAGNARTLVSLTASWERSSRQLLAARRDFGNMPLIVLTTGNPLPLPPELADDSARMSAEWSKMHAELAGLSTVGVNRTVPGAGHYIQLDRPDAVVEAVNEVIAAART